MIFGAARVAVLVPCFNEAASIGKVVADFLAVLPRAQIYVFDNGSTDATCAVARAAGAVVGMERRRGKGHVLRRMFADVDADCYIMVDGDDTYDASVAGAVVRQVIEGGFDFVNVARRSSHVEAYRRGHRFGNRVLTGMVRWSFGRQSSDMLSGYKGFSRRFVKSFPAMSGGFETETELVVHALELRMPMCEISADYRERPAGSQSKLRTYRDGARIAWLISRLIKDERPLPFFGFLGAALCVLGTAISVPVVATYFRTGLVPRLPTALLSVALVLLGWLCIFAGIILDVVTKSRQEMKRLSYLSIGKFAEPQ